VVSERHPKLAPPADPGFHRHRDGFFRSLHHLEVGDRLQLEANHSTQRYLVTDL